MVIVDYDLDALGDRAGRLLGCGRRLLGIAGAPGSGKSTLVELLLERLGHRASIVPMDGFHLADAELARLGRSDRKGAPDTFDRAGFAVALSRLRAGEETVYLPRFHREIEAAIAAEIAVEPSVELVLVEGNYLLTWPEVADQLDEIWYLDPPDEQRVRLLVARHVEYGRSAPQAEAWVARSDEANAAVVAIDRGRAGVIVRPERWPPSILRERT